jgi:ubiquitin-protein ligase
MLSPRFRRLKLDHETIAARFAGWPIVELTGTAGMPPEAYRFTYRIKGLYVGPTGEILERDTHHLEVNLSLGYPRRAPQCRMLTPVFHPNFDEASVCIGDFWAASEGLDDLIVRIGRMIAYQEYNTKSPLNGLAAKWAAQHAELLPIDARTIAPPKNEAGALTPETGASAVSQATSTNSLNGTSPGSSPSASSAGTEGEPTFLSITPDELGTATDPSGT